MSSWGIDISVYTLVASSIRHSLHGRYVVLTEACNVDAQIVRDCPNEPWAYLGGYMTGCHK